jgi:hypothetical protein
MPKAVQRRRQHSLRCTCGCNNVQKSRWAHYRRKVRLREEAKQQRDALLRAIGDFLQSEPSSSGGHPQLDTPLFNLNPSLPPGDPPAAFDSPQSPGDIRTEVSDHLVDDILLNFHTRTHRTTYDNDDEDSADTLEGDGGEAADTIDPKTNDFSDGEDIDTEDNMDPREGIVSDWDILAEEFIVEAEKLGEFEHSLLHTP